MEDSKDKERAHQILLQHQFNENRLVAERTSLFALSNSVLLIAFAMLVPVSKIVCTVLAIVGLIFCVVTWGALRSSVKALEVWVRGQKQIEEQEDGCFAYMREKQISPQIYGWSWQRGVAKWWRLFPYIAVLIFAIWVSALVHVWCLS